jgi:ribosomal protein S18 acetylase RimI-like enzyme
MSNLHPREYRQDDLVRVLAIFDSNVPEFFTIPERTEFEAFLSELPGPYLVIEDSRGDLVACGGYAIVPAESRADLCWGMVSREQHGRGIGRVLTAMRIAAARSDARVDSVILSTSQHTRGFYESLGFVTERVVVNGFAPGLDRCDMRLLTRADRL